MKPVLEIQHVSKAYRIRHHAAGYLTIREQFVNLFKRNRESVEEFFALDDVSFKVEAGESIGLIGRNGAGKSTLLKIISRIIAPGKGRIIARGRVGSLLEVGTGFHPELTGRENIFFNGSLLGMTRKEIERNFDAIVDFSGVEKFLDTPLKHYSSGMQLRLAFSVAAFLEPEILIIDEVLAVGDAEFQRKCILKMEDVHRGGRTILFVSHNMAAVQNLCRKCIILQNGKIVFQGESGQAVARYAESMDRFGLNSGSSVIHVDQPPVDRVEILCDGKLSIAPYMGCKAEFRVYFRRDEPMDFPVLGLIFRDSSGLPLIAVNNKHYQAKALHKPVQSGVISMTIPYLTLFAGHYSIDLHFGNRFHDLVVIRDCVQLKVGAMNFSPGGELPDRQYNRFFIKDIFWAISEDEPTNKKNIC